MNLWSEACKVLLDGTGTLSKKHTAYLECYPSHLVSQKGVHVLGVDNKTYVDWIGGLGANLDGFGVSMSIPSHLEIKAATMLTKRFPIDKVKILKSGSAACHGAVRIARACCPGRPWVYGTGYHGWIEPYVTEPPKAGVINGNGMYQKVQDIQEIYSLCKATLPCAVIIEPVELDDSAKRKREVRKLRQFCIDNEILFIADEIITGSRWKKFSVSADWDLSPDLMCLGKGMAGGHAIGIIGGSSHVMNKAEKAGVFISTTFSGVVPDLEALIHHLETWTETDLALLWLRGARLMRVFNKISKRVQLIGYPTRLTWKGDELDVAKFWQGMCGLGHLCGKAFFIGSCHTDDVINEFLAKSKVVLKNLNEIKLIGPLPRPAFKR